MGEAMAHYSLWLSADNPWQRPYQDVINAQALSLGYAPFDAHLTLLGAIRSDPVVIKRRFLRLATLLSPIKCYPLKIEAGDSYHKCIYVKMALTNRLWYFHQAARSVLRAKAGPYRPHVSLVYGNYSDGRKIQIKRRLDNIGFPVFNVSRLELREKGEDENEFNCIITVRLPLVQDRPDS